MRVADARASGLASRRAIDPRRRRRASEAICATIARSRWFRNAIHVAVYLPMPDEVDLRPLIRIAVRSGKRVYAPVVEPTGGLRFVSLDRHTQFTTGAFGITEPRINRRRLAATVPASGLHLICAPLSAFDHHCHRTGMGGGYYDRCFMHRRRRHSQRLVGVGFEVQRVAKIDVRDWDITMDAIVSERRVYRKRAESGAAHDKGNAPKPL